MSKMKVHNEKVNNWGEIVNEPRLVKHEEELTSSDKAGHVMIDGVTLVLDENGKLKISDEFIDMIKGLIEESR